MTEMRCEQVKELAPEVALDIATGEERDAVLRHVATCGDCRQLVYELSTVGDEVLTALAPARQPSPGFESRVLEVLNESSKRPAWPRTRRRPWLRLALATGAVAVAGVVGAATVYQATSADRQLGEAYRATLEVGNGSFFAAAPVDGSGARVGTAFAYQGDPSWVMVTLDDSSETEQTYAVRIATREDGYVSLGEAALEEGDRTWGGTLPVDLAEVHEIQFLDQDGEVVFTAVMVADNPWD